MKTVSANDIERLKASGSNVRPLQQKPAEQPKAEEKSSGNGDALLGILEGLTETLRSNAKKDDLKTAEQKLSSAEKKIESLQETVNKLTESVGSVESKARAAAKKASEAYEMSEELSDALVDLPKTVRLEAQKLIASIPQPKVEEVHHHPVIETREIVKPVHTVETKVERIVEAPVEPLTSLSVERDWGGFITRVITNKGTFTVERDAQGLISGVVRA